MANPLFTAETLKFLSGLARHNDREWFEARRDVYERAVREPLLALIEEVNAGMAPFAASHVRPPARTAMRIYRDTRFSPDKRPYKRHLGAWWAERNIPRTTGAGFYFHLSGTGVVFAAGMFTPTAPQLLAVRRWMVNHHAAYEQMRRKVLSSKGEGQFACSDPEALRRVPRGFTADSPAADLLRATRWGVDLTLPATAALEAGFAQQLVVLFRRSSPLVLALASAIRLEGEDSPDPVSSETRKPSDPLF